MERWMARSISQGGYVGRIGAGTQPDERDSDSDADSELAHELFNDYLRGAESAKRTTKIARMMCKVRRKPGKFDLLWKLSRAGLDKRNACRNLHRLIDRKDILFPVPIDAVKITVAIRKPYYKSTQLWWPILRISDWVPCLVKHSPQAILAGHRLEDVLGWQRAFQDFWKEYKLVNPTHCFYTDGLDAKFSVPFFVHGDEGRGYCRRPYLVESWQPVLGWKGKGATNEGAHSMTTRFLLTCISSYFFHKQDTLDDLHEAIADDAYHLYWNGVDVGSQIRLRLVCVGTKGDWVYLRKAFHLNCGFNCTAKCHLCDAQDWENMSHTSAWRRTIGSNRSTSPFHPERIPLLRIPGMQQDTILPDSLHCFHLGWGIDLASSGLVLLAKQGCFGGGSLDARLEAAYRLYTGWCHTNKKTTGINWWSIKKLDMSSTNDFPTSLGSVNSKAYDTALVLSWLEVFLRGIDCSNDDLLKGLLYAVGTSNEFFRALRRSGVFVYEPERSIVLHTGQEMCEAYGYLAWKSCTLRLKLFRLRPKLHFQQHLVMLMGTGPALFSALNFSCWSDEDYIGKISQLSRSVHPTLCTTRCIQKALGLYKLQCSKVTQQSENR